MEINTLNNTHLLELEYPALSAHAYLDKDDKCYYLGDYISKGGYSCGPTNNIVYNFKKPMDKKGKSEFIYKQKAINSLSSIFSNLINPEIAITFVPIPPSKSKDDPNYDDRGWRLCKGICENNEKWVAKELILQTQTIEPFHNSKTRLHPEKLESYYVLNESQLPVDTDAIFLFDDVLTTGAHFKAAKNFLLRIIKNSPLDIIGLFIARRRLENE